MNEVEAMQYIKQHFQKPLSRRTYYNYKKMIYNKYSLFYNEDENPPKEVSRFINLSETNNIANCKQLNRFLLLDAKGDLIKKGLEMSICLDGYEKINLFPKYFINSLNHAKSVITHSRNFIKQFKSRSYLYDTNHKSLPTNVTIRREYIKCGKNSCSRCNHGPYYYGYWREKNGKLKKKYIGINK